MECSPEVLAVLIVASVIAVATLSRMIYQGVDKEEKQREEKERLYDEDYKMRLALWEESNREREKAIKKLEQEIFKTK